MAARMDGARLNEGIRRMRFEDLLARQTRGALARRQRQRCLGSAIGRFGAGVTGCAMKVPRGWTIAGWVRPVVGRRRWRSSGCWVSTGNATPIEPAARQIQVVLEAGRFDGVEISDTVKEFDR